MYDITTVDKNYIESAKRLDNIKNVFARKATEAKNAESLLLSGVITYDKILEKSYELLNNASVLTQVAAKAL